MKKLLILTIAVSPFLASAQSLRYEVEKQVSILYDIVESSSLIIKTSNLDKDKELIQAGMRPLIIGVYRFEKEGMNQPLLTVEETYWHKDRSLISKYSNEKNPKREDYATFWLSQIATFTWGPVLQDNDGIYFTKQTIFNLE